MGLIKMMFLPMKMMMWPHKAHHMKMRPFKMAFHFVTVTLLLAQLMVMLFLAAMFVMFTVVPAVIVGVYWMKKKMRMGKHGKMHMPIPSSRRFKP